MQLNVWFVRAGEKEGTKYNDGIDSSVRILAGENNKVLSGWAIVDILQKGPPFSLC